MRDETCGIANVWVHDVRHTFGMRLRHAGAPEEGREHRVEQANKCGDPNVR
jgi:hypothetical protein